MPRISIGLPLLLAALCAACSGGTADVSSTEPELARVAAAAAAQSDTVDFIVVFKSTVTQPEQAATKAVADANQGAQIRFTYTRAIKGFAVRVPRARADAFIEAIGRNPNVDFVEPDVEVHTQTDQPNATWGLDRSDQRALPLNGIYRYTASGQNVHAYVIDTGIYAAHSDFGGRVEGGFTAIADGRGTADCNGHGTHVSGTLGGATWGIAKSVSLVPVRVLNCNGSGFTSGVIAGIDWMIANAVKPAVANMSLGGGASSSLDAAVANAVANGITMVVAAGNSSADACASSPARAPSAITVGATTSADAVASYSNYGTCVDLFAPGSSITSAGISSPTASATYNGTSMATPHVAGVAALVLEGNPSATPGQVSDMIHASATPDQLSGVIGLSPNLLIYTDYTDITPPPPGIISASIAALSGVGLPKSKNWVARVTVSVVSATGEAVPGAVVSGAFSVGGSSVVCTTASDSVCRVDSGTIPSRNLSTVFTVTGITGNRITYDASRNVVSSVVVRKP